MNRPESLSTAPPADRRLQVVAGVILLLPMLALVPVGWYAKAEPKLAGFPFFIWYQMALVFLCAACTSIAYVLVKKSRRVAAQAPRGEVA